MNTEEFVSLCTACLIYFITLAVSCIYIFISTFIISFQLNFFLGDMEGGADKYIYNITSITESVKSIWT